MYLRRKIDVVLEDWYKNKNHSPALIVGVRQCGKTESIKHFAYEHYKNVVYINFWENEAAKEIFDNSLEIKDIVRKIPLYVSNVNVVPNDTVFIFDEIQDCARARLSLKSFKNDNRFDVIATGSHIGLNIDSSSGVAKPNGSEDVFKMFTMDFEEFLWARGFNDNLINELNNHFKNKVALPEELHKKMKELYNEYISIGGYPEVVKILIDSNDYYSCFQKNESLIFDIKGDPSKRKGDDGKPLYTPYEISRIQNSFDLIASFQYNDNHRYVLSQIVGGNGIQKKDAILYLINSGVAFKVNNLTNPSLPLIFNKIESDFKLFYGDIGILSTLSGFDIIQGIMRNTLGMSKGYLYEAAVADQFYKNQIPTYYFKKESGLEIDFVISYEGLSTLIEAKAKNGRTKSSKTVMTHPDHYGKTRLIKIGDYKVSFENDILSIPHYLTFLIKTDTKI